MACLDFLRAWSLYVCFYISCDPLKNAHVSASIFLHTYVKMHFYVSCCPCCPILSICLHVPQLTPPRKWPSAQFLCKYPRILIFQFQIFKGQKRQSEHLVETKSQLKRKIPSPFKSCWCMYDYPTQLCILESFSKGNLPKKRGRWKPGIENSIKKKYI